MLYYKNYFSVFIALFLISLVAGCTSSTKLQNRSTSSGSQPISVSDSSPVAFYKISFNIERGKKIGNHHQGAARVEYNAHTWDYGAISGEGEFKKTANEELSRYGYNVPSTGESMFEADNTGKAKYQLGADVVDIRYNTYGSLAGGFSEAKIWVEWRLYNSTKEKVVYENSKSGYHREENGSSAFIGAFVNSLHGLLSSNEFVKVLQKSEGKNIENKSYSKKIKIENKNKEFSLPNGLEKLNKAVVTIIAGSGHGTGFFISESGYLLTANHVVSGLKSVDIKTNDGITLKAEVVRSDAKSDVALLKARGSGFEFIGINTENQDLGSEVYAIGTPADRSLSNSVTKGVLSKYRNLDQTKFIQTDVSVNRGNSGGPLLNRRGQVIGIVSWKFSTREGFEGLSFGVSIDQATESIGVSLN